MDFILSAPFQPTGDQLEAIRQLVKCIHQNGELQCDDLLVRTADLITTVRNDVNGGFLRKRC
jgi:hypothetical protein